MIGLNQKEIEQSASPHVLKVRSAEELVAEFERNLGQFLDGPWTQLGPDHKTREYLGCRIEVFRRASGPNAGRWEYRIDGRELFGPWEAEAVATKRAFMDFWELPDAEARRRRFS